MGRGQKMKKLFNLLMLFIISLPVFAGNTANIRINIQGGNNQYYLCFVDTGCFLIREGKIYSIYHRVDVSHLFLIRKADHRMAPLPLSSSCNKVVQRNQTVTISGVINNMRVNNLHCTVR